jgi:methyl-accepting chemotaxis protein
MSDLSGLARDYGPWGAIVAMVLYLIAQQNGMLGNKITTDLIEKVSTINADMRTADARIASLGGQISAVSSRVSDHDGRIGRTWDAIGEVRGSAIPDLSKRMGEVERVADRVVDRLNDQRSDSIAIKASLKSISEAVQEIKRDSDVFGVRLNAIARSVGVGVGVGVDRVQPGAR